MDLEGCCRDLIEVPSWPLAGETVKINEKPVRVADVPVGIRTDHLPNTSQEVGFEVLAAFFMKSYISGCITPCSPLKIN
jgi:hypothetical protein